jgi:hypothetical protein
MKTETGSANATVKDFSLIDPTNENGPRNDGSNEVEVPYTFSYNILENDTELRNEFSPKDLLDLGNARLKSSANSAARQKAIAPYAQDPNSQGAIRERMVKDAMKLGKTKEQAEAFVDSLLNA